tara:strand:+ start:65 stop:352 length:288 start_codon:yes stop_codon:yes gene_type:complete
MKHTLDKVLKKILNDLDCSYYIVTTRKQLGDLPRFCMIQYLHIKSNNFRKGGLLYENNLKEGYIILQSKAKTKKGKPIRWSVQLKEVVLFTNHKN